MKNLDKQKELAKEAVRLIKEFRKESEILGENPLVRIKIKKGGAIIEAEDAFSGVEEYALNEISSIFSTEMRGWGPCSAGFYEAMSLAESDLESDFEKLSKMEFKKYVGNLKYAEYRCEAIYKRLEEIEKEALSLIK